MTNVSKIQVEDFDFVLLVEHLTINTVTTHIQNIVTLNQLADTYVCSRTRSRNKRKIDDMHNHRVVHANQFNFYNILY